MRSIRRAIAIGEGKQYHGSPDFLDKLLRLVKQGILTFTNRYFIFFLDDYTEERVPFSLQNLYHPIICQRSSDVCFKISSHMFGSIYCEPQPIATDAGRNIQTINLGTAYLKRDRRRAEGKLLLKILNERFEHCDGWSGTIEDWLGKTVYPGGKTQARH